ncbi:MAG: hypothetical protein H0T08_03710, partial [Acidobacteria bacterium]|nr:hypothetical protein [Acidobacteriota bacterium]
MAVAVKEYKNISRFCIAHRWSLLLLIFTFGTFSTFAQNPQPTPPPVQEDDGDKKPISIKTDLVTLTLTV